MGKLLLDVPSIDTKHEYQVGKGLRITKGRKGNGDKYDPNNTWHADIVAVGSEAHHETPDATATIGGLPPIENQGRREWVRRVVIELRHDASQEYLERVSPGQNVEVYDNYGNRVRSQVLMAFDIKRIEE